MDFFAQQEKARRATGLLVALYVLAVIGTVAAIYGIALVAITFLESDKPPVELAQNSYLILGSVALPLAIILIGSLWKIVSLADGGPAVAKELGGREVLPNTCDFREKRLYNVVEEMAIAAGIRVPSVFILDNEEGINAFAAGYSSKDASVTVTRGALVSLNREELQGVIGHEFSHVLNGDMRLNIWLIGVLGGILCIAIAGTCFMRVGGELLRCRPRRSGKKDDTASIALVLLLFGVLIYLAGSIGHFFGRLIQAAVSRKRECLADASSVQFTRNPLGLANALKLIGANATQGTLHAGKAGEISHMFFVSGLDSFFATHPPLEQRIQLLDPQFQGDYSGASRVLHQRLAAVNLPPPEKDEESDLHAARLATILAAHSTRQAPPPAAPGQETLSSSRSSTVSAPLADAAPAQPAAFLSGAELTSLADPSEAEACLYATLLEPQDESLFTRQLDSLGNFANAVRRWADAHRGWTSRERRAAAELAFRTLRSLSANRRANIVRTVDELSGLDGQIDSFEFALSRLMRRRFLPDSPLRRRTIEVDWLRPEMRTVLSALARFGDRTGTNAEHAFVTGWNRLEGNPGDAPACEMMNLDRLDDALNKLEALPPTAKQNFLAACRAVVNDDAVITEDEANVLAAIADSIGADGWSA